MKTISKRWIKNAVAIVVMLALCGSMVFTMSYAKSHAQASDMPQMSQGSDSSGGPGGGGTPPDQSGSSDSNSQSGNQQNTQDSSGQQNAQPPAKPEDSGNSGQSENSIEGKNSVTINDCELTDDNTTLNGQSTTYKNIFLYQSMSGDAADGQAEFTATNSDITTNKGDTLYVTNTTASINLKNNTITNNDSEGNFLRAQADSWGSSGSNGGNVTLTMTKQKASGNIVIDSISTLDMTMKSGSSYTGTINGDNSAKSIKLTLDKKSKIKLTGDSYVTSLDDADTDYSNIDFNGYTLYVNGTAINK